MSKDSIYLRLLNKNHSLEIFNLRQSLVMSDNPFFILFIFKLSIIELFIFELEKFLTFFRNFLLSNFSFINLTFSILSFILSIYELLIFELSTFKRVSLNLSFSNLSFLNLIFSIVAFSNLPCSNFSTKPRLHYSTEIWLASQSQ